MFAQPRMVFRRGELVYRDGEFLKACEKSTVLASSCHGPEGFAWSQNAANRQRWQDHYGYSPWVTCMRQEELLGERRSIVYS